MLNYKMKPQHFASLESAINSLFGKGTKIESADRGMNAAAMCIIFIIFNMFGRTYLPGVKRIIGEIGF